MNICVYYTEPGQIRHLLFEVDEYRYETYYFIDSKYPEYGYINGFSDHNAKDFIFIYGAKYI